MYLDVLFALFRIVWRPFSAKGLSSWFSACGVYYWWRPWCLCFYPIWCLGEDVKSFNLLGWIWNEYILVEDTPSWCMPFQSGSLYSVIFVRVWQRRPNKKPTLISLFLNMLLVVSWDSLYLRGCFKMCVSLGSVLTMFTKAAVCECGIPGLWVIIFPNTYYTLSPLCYVE